MTTWIKNRPWLFVPVFFLILIAAWIVLFRIAAKHAPEPVPIETRPDTTETHSSDADS